MALDLVGARIRSDPKICLCTFRCGVYGNNAVELSGQGGSERWISGPWRRIRHEVNDYMSRGDPLLFEEDIPNGWWRHNMVLCEVDIRTGTGPGDLSHCRAAQCIIT